MNQGVLLALFLLAVLLVAHTARPWSRPTRDRPLDVETGLPLPWAGYGSTVFSLTGLFGAYLGVLLLVGLTAFVGIAAGAIGGLLFARREIAAFVRSDSARGFQEFLAARRLSTSVGSHGALWKGLSVLQLGLAVSELLLLREVLHRTFDLSPTHSTALTLSLGLITYAYCLAGGYAAVFRTDIAQFVAMILMCSTVAVVSLLLAPESPGSTDSQAALMVPGDPWVWGFRTPKAVSAAVHLGVGVAMGFVLVVSTPDTWKRLFVGARRGRSYGSVIAMLIAGGLPFLSLLPLVRRLEVGIGLMPLDYLASLHSRPFVGTALLFGLVAAFMSTFDSALVASTHLLLVLPRSHQREGRSNLQVYRLYLGLGFLVTVLATLLLVGRATNPYFVGNLLTGPFGVLAGLILGTRFMARPSRWSGLTAFALLLVMIWLVYFFGQTVAHDLVHVTSMAQARTFVVGVLLFLAAAVAAWFTAVPRGGAT